MIPGVSEKYSLQGVPSTKSASSLRQEAVPVAVSPFYHEFWRTRRQSANFPPRMSSINSKTVTMNFQSQFESFSKNGFVVTSELFYEV